MARPPELRDDADLAALELHRDRQPIRDEDRAAAPSRPGPRPSVARFEELADRHRGVDQADVRVRLREVAEQRAGVGIDVLAEEAHRVGVARDALEDLDRRDRAGP